MRASFWLNNSVNHPKPDMKSYTYLLHWIDQDMTYYGFRCGNKVPPEEDLWARYFTSSKYVKDFRKQHGEPDVVMIDRIFDDRVEAKLYETEYLRQFGVPKAPGWLNRSDGSQTFMHGSKHTEETRQKMSAAAKKRVRFPCSESTKEKIAAAQRGKPRKSISDEHKAAISKANRARPLSPEHKEKIRQGKLKHALKMKESLDQ